MKTLETAAGAVRRSRRAVTLLVPALLILALGGTAQSAGETVNADPVELRFAAALKTHAPGRHAEADRHGTPEYRLLLQVDGREVPLQVTRQREDREAAQLVDPEAGDGVRYRFSAALRLPPGSHRVVVTLPEEGISAERQVTLAAVRTSRLTVTPVYGAGAGRRGQGSFGTASFTKGIVGLRLNLNGRPL